MFPKSWVCGSTGFSTKSFFSHFSVLFIHYIVWYHVSKRPTGDVVTLPVEFHYLVFSFLSASLCCLCSSPPTSEVTTVQHIINSEFGFSLNSWTFSNCCQGFCGCALALPPRCCLRPAPPSSGCCSVNIKGTNLKNMQQTSVFPSSKVLLLHCFVTFDEFGRSSILHNCRPTDCTSAV